MAAGPALEMWSKQTGTRENPDGRRRAATLQRAYTVTLDATDDLDVATSASGLPLVGELYPGTRTVVCRKLSLSRLSPVLAQITCHYSGEVSPNNRGEPPIDTSVKISGGWITTEEAIDQDINGAPLVTANNEPIDGITERFVDDRITIERNYINWNPYLVRMYKRATNSDTFFGYPPGTARLMDIGYTAEYVNGQTEFFRVRAQVQFREAYNTTPDKAWRKRVRHEGFLVRKDASSDPEPAWDPITKTRATRPVLLKENGTRETNPDNAVWLEFETLKSLPFSALGLLN